MATKTYSTEQKIKIHEGRIAMLQPQLDDGICFFGDAEKHKRHLRNEIRKSEKAIARMKKSDITFTQQVAADCGITLTDEEALKHYGRIMDNCGHSTIGQDVLDAAKEYFIN